MQALWGVGPATLDRLSRFGVRTVGDLAALPEATLTTALGTATGAQLQQSTTKILDIPESVRQRAMAIFGR